MERVTIRIPKRQLNEIEKRVRRGEFPNRSEAVRTAIREHLYDDDGDFEERPAWESLRG